MELNPLDYEFLTAHPLFGGLTRGQVEDLGPFLDENEYSSGSFLFKEGDQGDRLYFLIGGTVEVLKQDPEEGEQLLSTIAPGGTFGEMSIIEAEKRSASVRARGAVSTVSLRAEALDEIQQKHPQIYSRILGNIARELSRRLRSANDKACHVLFEPEIA